MSDLHDSFVALSELELSEYFCAQPAESEVDDGYWCYAVRDARGVELRFSFNLYERSVQTELRLAGSMIATVSHEGAVAMRRDGDSLRCEFRLHDSKATLTLKVGNAIQVDWATLRA